MIQVYPTEHALGKIRAAVALESRIDMVIVTVIRTPEYSLDYVDTLYLDM